MDNETSYPYALDIGIFFVAVQLGPVAPVACVGALAFTVARRSGLFLGLVLDLVAQLTGSVDIPDTPVVRGLLPGLENVPKVKHARQLAACARPVHQAVTPAQGRPPSLSLADIAQADNILVVGPKGSGKTTVLTLLITQRRGAHIALDPHNAPGKWPCSVVGGGLDYVAIAQVLASAYSTMRNRYQALNQGTVTEHQCRAKSYTVVGDEFRSISREVPGSKQQAGASAVLLDLLTQGRKAGIFTLIAAHADTVKALGIEGEGDLRSSFDWIVYLGGMAVRKVSGAAQLPRPAVAYHTERDDYHLLCLPGVKRSDSQAGPAGAEPDDRDTLTTLLQQSPEPGNTAGNTDDLLPPVTNSVTSDVTACTSHVTGCYDVTEPDVTAPETAIITRLLLSGNSPSIVARKLPGYTPSEYKRFKAKVDLVKGMLDTATDTDGPDPDIGPFRDVLGGQS